MMLDTNGEIFPEGRYTLRVSEIPEEVDVKGYVAWQWVFEADTDEGPMPYRERFMVWLLAPLLRALKFPENAPGKFDFEPTQALNRTVTGAVKHVVLEKSGKTVARFIPDNPVGMSKAVRGALAAQAPAGKRTDPDIDF